MKKTLLFFALVMFLFTVKAQTVYKDYIDGQAYFAIDHNHYQQIRSNLGPKSVAINKLEYFDFLEKIFDKYGVTKVYQPFSNADAEKILRIFKIQFTDADKVDELLADLSKVPGLYNVEKVPLYHVFASPNDKYYNMHYTDNTPVLWHLQVINAPQAWDISYGSTGGKVGIVDNAILNTHEDLQNAIAATYDGESDTEGSSAPPSNTYEWSHGTHCAGLIGAQTNNNTGIASIGSGVEIYAAKGGRNSDGALVYISEGLNWQADQPINVLSMSFGGPGSSQNEQDFYTWLHDTKDVVLLAAAGNDGVTTESYPAAYDNVIAVASTNEDDSRSDFSNYGSWVSIAAPGGYANNNASIFSTTASTHDWGEGEVPYDVMQGTSMACPLAAGVVGLMRSLNPALSASQIEDCLFNSCVNVGTFVQHGRVDAYAAMQCVQQTLNGDPIANFTANTTSITEGDQVTFTDQSSDGGNAITSWSWSFPGGTPSSSTAQNPTVTYNTAGTYDVTLTVTNSQGNDTETKTGYIVVHAPASTECEDLSSDYTMGFEDGEDLSMWSIEDVNGDDTTWTILNSSQYAHSGSNFAGIVYNPNLAMDDYLYTKCLDLVAGNTYELSFWYRVMDYNGTVYPEKLEVKYGTDAEHTAMTNSIVDLGTIDNTTYMQSTNTFTPNQTGTYYIGFHGYSDADEFYIFIDDINISNTTPTGINDINNQVKVYPNPTTGILNVEGINNYNNIQVVDVNGKVVRNINTFTNQIDIRDLDQGNYLIKIITNDNVITKRISLIK